MNNLNGYQLSRNWFNFSFENNVKVSPNHTALYFFCIDLCNRLGWKRKFGLPSYMTMDAIGIINYKTYAKTLSDLVEWRFIELYSKSSNQHTATVIGLVINTNANSKALDKAMFNLHSTRNQSSVVINKPKTLKPKTLKHSNNYAEEISEYEKIDKSKKSIYKFIKDKNPNFIDPYVDYWNIFAKEYNRNPVQSKTATRENKLRLRLKEPNFNFTLIIKRLTKSGDFALKGSWLTFDWIIKSEDNVIKILEGQYDKSQLEIEQQHKENVGLDLYKSLDRPN